jgi:ABC-2 type transport system permease protein
VSAPTTTRSDVPGPGAPMPPASPWRVVTLVAGREIATRLRSKPFVISTVATIVLLGALALISTLVKGHGGDTFTVGVTPSTSVLAAPLTASAKSVGATVTTQMVGDEVAGRAEVSDGKLDALLIGDGSTVSVLVKKDVNTTLNRLFHVLASEQAFRNQIASLGGDPDQVNAAVARAPVTVAQLQAPHKYNTQQLVLGVIAGILVYVSLMLNGQAVAQGVVEEKSSRVVELLLATVRPWQLMAGKVLGIGVVGLIQMIAIGGFGVIIGLATGALTVSVSAAASTVIWLVVWYLLGFFAYALAFAGVAALVSRQEDVAGVVVPVLMFVVVGYVLGISILPSNPGNSFIAILSMIPTFAPTLMPMRLAMGGVPAWQSAVALAGIIAVIPLLVWASGRIYRNAVVRSGARVKLRDAWRAA